MASDDSANRACLVDGEGTSGVGFDWQASSKVLEPSAEMQPLVHVDSEDGGVNTEVLRSQLTLGRTIAALAGVCLVVVSVAGLCHTVIPVRLHRISSNAFMIQQSAATARAPALSSAPGSIMYLGKTYQGSMWKASYMQSSWVPYVRPIDRVMWMCDDQCDHLLADLHSVLKVPVFASVPKCVPPKCTGRDLLGVKVGYGVAAARKLLADGGKSPSWFVIMDDDTYIVPWNMEHLLQGYNPDEVVILCARLTYPGGFSIMGGAGVVYSRAAVDFIMNTFPESMETLFSIIQHKVIEGKPWEIFTRIWEDDVFWPHWALQDKLTKFGKGYHTLLNRLQVKVVPQLSIGMPTTQKNLGPCSGLATLTATQATYELERNYTSLNAKDFKKLADKISFFYGVHHNLVRNATLQWPLVYRPVCGEKLGFAMDVNISACA